MNNIWSMMGFTKCTKLGKSIQWGKFVLTLETLPVFQDVYAGDGRRGPNGNVHVKEVMLKREIIFYIREESDLNFT